MKLNHLHHPWSDPFNTREHRRLEHLAKLVGRAAVLDHGVFGNAKVTRETFSTDTLGLGFASGAFVPSMSICVKSETALTSITQHGCRRRCRANR